MDKEAIERGLLQLRGVEAARVFTEGEEITEVHVVGRPGSRPKHLARDVRSFLAAALGIEVNHQKISVAVRGENPTAERVRTGAARDVLGSRVRLHSVNVLIEGLRSEVQVRAGLGGKILDGHAVGVPCRLGTERLVAEAVLDALQKVLSQDVRLVAGDLAFTRLGPGEVVLVEVVIVRQRTEERLVGACKLGQERMRSVAYATLDALNRILPTLGPKEWVEYEVAGQSEEE